MYYHLLFLRNEMFVFIFYTYSNKVVINVIIFILFDIFLQFLILMASFYLHFKE